MRRVAGPAEPCTENEYECQSAGSIRTGPAQRDQVQRERSTSSSATSSAAIATSAAAPALSPAVDGSPQPVLERNSSQPEGLTESSRVWSESQPARRGACPPWRGSDTPGTRSGTSRSPVASSKRTTSSTDRVERSAGYSTTRVTVAPCVRFSLQPSAFPMLASAPQQHFPRTTVRRSRFPQLPFDNSPLFSNGPFSLRSLRALR